MARTVRDAKLETRTARARLKEGSATYWRTLVPGQLHLGYRRRRADAPGSWVARRYIGLDAGGVGRYRKQRLGVADDYQDADGSGVLSFADAQQLAYGFEGTSGGNAGGGGPLTVKQAMEDYLVYLRAERKTGDDAERRANVHILPELGDVAVADLTTDRLVRWRDALAASPARTRTRKGAEQTYRPAPATADERRARRATVNRTVTVLKGALNRAFKTGRVNDDLAWRRLEPFAKVDVARPGHLSVAEAQRLINAADERSGFRALAHGALLTGCRYGELCRMVVGDFQRGRVVVRESKSGKSRDVRLTEEGIAFFKRLTAGRAAGQPLFRRARGEPWDTSHQKRPMRDACAAARIEPAISFHQLRHTWASLAVMNGMPLMVVAENLGHSDTRMVEKHYGHLTEDYRDEAIKASGPRFGIEADTSVVTLQQLA
jgi:integrase